MADFASSVVVNAALDGIDEVFGTKVIWKPENLFQSLIIEHAAEARTIGSTLSVEQLIKKAAHDAETVNRFLRLNGFEEVQLQDMGSGPNMAYAAAVMKLLGRFSSPGRTGYHLPETRSPAFRLDKAVLQHFQNISTEAIRISTLGGFDLWVANSTVIRSGFLMLDDWIEIIRTARAVPGNGGVLPLVKIDTVPVDISKLIGMTDGNLVVIQQAIAAARFKLTNFEVSFEMAAAVSAKRMGIDMNSIEDGDFVVKGPLYFALVKRQTPLMPLAAGIVQPGEFYRGTELV
ncbi:MAG: hypothetical protein UW68_C0042G0003 [Candidatus Collierbacteria bacterium GW2011_GWB1_44_6]|uniref:Uncharacterized protein n=1 Tax=Candidatus Collierbacteria bacterium GW2011_GWB1_44_6 TaxID=1618384 RepID=A0A0G1JLM8_9BACT|nr:MAG: hypothetical protein UW68_C0042G0003 [Candidatus Collierbacteria bacterium GW2011_GWB1_44_6]KKT82657.1 MAG: hypothetical protein UW80_C0033G0002 [Microgenomates group bacterium GW2011_GWC1_44_9]